MLITNQRSSGQKLKVRVDLKKVDVETTALWQRFGAVVRLLSGSLL
jgi:hypothetical protein